MIRIDPVRPSTPLGVIFDLDGVLIDSEPFWREGFRAAVRSLCGSAGRATPELTDAALVRYEGGRVSDTVAQLARDLVPELSSDQVELRRASDVAIETASRLFGQEPAPIADSIRTAREIHSLGIALAVASSSAEPFIRTALQTIGLADIIPVVQSAYELERTKPDPAVYLLTLEALDLPASRCVAVEDSLVGLEASLRAGLATVWFSPDPAVSAPDLDDVAHLPPVHRVDRVSTAAVLKASAT